MRADRLVSLFFFCLFLVWIGYMLVNDAYASERNSRVHSVDTDVVVNAGM